MDKRKRDANGRPICPVCGKTSYSKDGIHPQCQVRLAERELDKQIAKEAKRKSPDKKPWEI